MLLYMSTSLTPIHSYRLNISQPTSLHMSLSHFHIKVYFHDLRVAIQLCHIYTTHNVTWILIYKSNLHFCIALGNFLFIILLILLFIFPSGHKFITILFLYHEDIIIVIRYIFTKYRAYSDYCYSLWPLKNRWHDTLWIQSIWWDYEYSHTAIKTLSLKKKIINFSKNEKTTTINKQTTCIFEIVYLI